jgi:MFS family permease
MQAACFCAAQFLSSFPWGKVSDRLGRRPMVIMSNFSSCVSVIAFGMAPSYVWAAIFRLAGGLFNCTFV